jgi:carnitine O-acetyltransferase
VSDLILQNETKVLEFRDYGKLFIVSHNMSPDAFVQVAFQAAYYRMYGSNPNVYESVQTKFFYHGRTEAMRSCTPEAKAFANVFCSGAASVNDKVEALRRAVGAHVKLVRECSKGGGVDRHLFALNKMWSETCADEGMPIPEIFDDAGWPTLQETILSTSNCGNPALRLFGFGPVSRNGFGLGYIIKDNSISVCAASKRRQTERFMVRR